jgi:hypothetical protein
MNFSKSTAAAALARDRSTISPPSLLLEPGGELLALLAVHHHPLDRVALVQLRESVLDQVGIEHVPVTWRVEHLHPVEQPRKSSDGMSSGTIAVQSHFQATSSPTWTGLPSGMPRCW